MTFAGFWKRVAAAFVDGVVIVFGGTIIVICFTGLFMAGGIGDPQALRMMGNAVTFIACWTYFAVMESSDAQGTVGKIVLGIKVTDLEGRKISFSKATARCFAKIVSTLILLFGFAMAGFMPRKQALHDMMTECLVVNR